MHAQFRLRARYVHGCNSARNLWMPVEERRCSVFMGIGVIVQEYGIQACHCLKDKERTIMKFINKKDSPSIDPLSEK